MAGSPEALSSAPNPAEGPASSSSGRAARPSPPGHARLARLPEKLAQVEISFLDRLILIWMGSLIQFTPWARLSC